MVDAAELPINTSATAMEMAETIFGDDIQIESVSYSGDPASSGIYSDGLATAAGFAPSDTGLILSTGQAQSVTNSSGDANQENDTSTNTAGGIDGDEDFDEAAGQDTFDAAFIEAEFIPEGDTLTLQFVFSSEEYPEFVNSGFNDTIGVWVNGEQIEISVGEGQTSVDAVNAGQNANLFVDNTDGDFNTEMDGFTVTLSLKATVNAGDINTIKIGIADAGDSIYDSNLLIAANSVQSTVIAVDDEFSQTANKAKVVDLLENDQSADELTITHLNGIPVVAGDTIELPSGEMITLNGDGTVTVLTDGDIGANTFSYTAADEDGVSDTAIATVTTTAPCFTTGAMIETASGPRAIEDLSVGDQIVTRDNGLRPLRWIGRRKISAMSDALAPILVRKGALGCTRDMRVSPQHRMIISGWRAKVLFSTDEVMARAKDLLDGEMITSQPVAEVEYWHLLLDRHEVIYADGAPTESFFPGDEGLTAIGSGARQEVFALFPELRSRPTSFGPGARMALKRHEAQMLIHG